MIDPLALLRRTDKWYLGNGGMLIYAPPFPKNLHTPGFWDECHWGDLALPRLLCLSFAVELDDALYELDPHNSFWHWQPDRIEAKSYLVVREGIGFKQQHGVRIFLNERRSIGPDGTLHDHLSFELLAECPVTSLHVVAWTARQRTAEGEQHSAFAFADGMLSYTQAAALRAHGRGETGLPLQVEMRGSRKPSSVQVTPSHGANLVPRLAFTPMWDALAASPAEKRRLSGEVRGDNVYGSVTYAALHWELPLRQGKLPGLELEVHVGSAGTTPTAAKGGPWAARVGRRQDQGGRPMGRPYQPGGYHQSLSTPDPGKAWREFISLVPHFECSDEMLTRYYWYRWYGLRLNAVPPGGNYVAPAVTEGIAYFRGVITYSLMCHLNECKWLADPALAQGCLQNHIALQTKAGHLAGHIYVSHANTKGFYHTDVGGSVQQLLLHHPDASFSADVLPALEKLAAYYLSERDGEGLHLFDVRDQYETGQEFTSRYFHADKRADAYGWDHALRLKGVDVTFYVYNLLCLLEALHQGAGNPSKARRFGKLAEAVRLGVSTHMWDPRRRFFFDYSAKSGRRSPYWAAVGLYPLINELATDAQALAAARHLADPQKFATPWPTPSVPPEDPYFQRHPRWRGERANCPWNGRVWPMINGHVVEAYGRLAELDPPRYRPALAAYLRRYVEMMHFEREGAAGDAKDPARPNCFEHYDPVDGRASDYRGIDDYMHSEVVNGILRYVAGVRLSRERDRDGSPRTLLCVDPFPFDLSQFLLRGARVAGLTLDVCWNRTRGGGHAQGYRIHLDGRLAFQAKEIRPWECELS